MPAPVLSYARTAWGSNPFISSFKRSIWAIGSIGISVLFGAVQIWSSLLDRGLCRRLIDGPVPKAIEFNQAYARETVVDWSALAIWIAATAAFACWVYRAYYNLRAFPGTSPKYQPKQAVGRFFVPVLNLVRIPQVMREIYTISMSWDDENSGSAIVTWWWGTYIIPQAFAYCIRWTFVQRGFNGLTDRLLIETWLGIARPLWMCIPGVLAIVLICKITRMQARKTTEDEFPIPAVHPTIMQLKPR